MSTAKRDLFDVFTTCSECGADVWKPWGLCRDCAGIVDGIFKGKLTDEQVKLLQRPGKMTVVKRTGWIEA